MAFKIYTKGNIFYLEDLDTEILYEGFSKNILMRRFKSSSSNFTFENLKNWKTSDLIDFSEIDLTNADYNDLETFIDWCENSLGKYSLQASGLFSKMIVERLINQQSSALNQNPTGLGPDNAIQIEYGPGSGTISDDVMISSTGVLTFNKAGTYRIKIALQFGRTGNPSSSILLFRVIDINNIQLGRSIGYLVSSSDETSYLENDTWLTVPAGFVVKSQVMRDASGINSGGLTSITPSVSGGNEWNFVPTASIRVLKFTAN